MLLLFACYPRAVARAPLRPRPPPARRLRPDPRHGPRLLRVDGRLHGHAHDHRRLEGASTLLVGLLDLPPRLHGDDASLRPPGRPVRAAPHPPDGHPALPD